MRTSDGLAIDPWREYGLRKKVVLFLAVGMIIIPTGVLLVLLRFEPPLIRYKTAAMICWFVPFFIAFVAWFVAVVRFWLWKCPRCGCRFIGVYDAFAFFRRRCFYCHLPIGSDPASVAK
jgi:hypothetical protein